MDQVVFYVEGKDSNVEIAWECGCSNMTGWECNLNIVGWFHLEQVNNVSDCFEVSYCGCIFFQCSVNIFACLLLSFPLSCNYQRTKGAGAALQTCFLPNCLLLNKTPMFTDWWGNTMLVLVDSPFRHGLKCKPQDSSQELINTTYSVVSQCFNPQPVQGCYDQFIHRARFLNNCLSYLYT